MLLVVTIFLLTMTAIYTTDRQSVTFGEEIVGAVVTPFQSLLTSASSGIGNFFGYFGNIDTLKEENKRMQEEIYSLSDSVRKMEQHKLENERFREMLELKKSMADYGLVGAEVIGKDPGNWFNSFTIDKGTSSGLAVRQPVMTSSGLVGHIYEIGSNWARVLTIIDANSSVGAIVVRTRDVAVIESDAELAEEGLCKMTYVGKSASVIPGDIIETSGLGGIYPKGLLIGKIREIRPATAGMSQYAIIEPSTDLERISEVFVVTDYPAGTDGG